MATDVCGVYAIVNTVNGHHYVGSAKAVHKRWREHRRQLRESRHHSFLLQKAWNKYGSEVFAFRVLARTEIETLTDLEQVFIDRFDPYYNIAPRAGSQLGYRHSEETRAKLRVARARNPSSAMKGRRHTAETRARISAAKTGVRHGPYSLKHRESIGRARAKVDESTVRLVRQLKSDGLSHAEVALLTNVGYWTVADIARGAIFQWVH